MITALAAVALLAFSGAADAQQGGKSKGKKGKGGPAVVLKGEVTSFENGAITLKSKDGDSITVRLADRAGVFSLSKISFADVKPGDFIASAGMRQKDGSLQAVELRIFPEQMRGRGEGHRPFRGGPESTMTNATVDAVVGGVSGRTIKVKYPEGEKIIKVPEDVPVMRMGLDGKKHLKPGAHAAVFARKGNGGALSAFRVLVGADGFIPPL
ncbi:MAG: hypothetical protein O3A84_03475 [Proteobacteria bacterium]|nr:hypothetical protein [Pseudomonadota bacterium]